MRELPNEFKEYELSEEEELRGAVFSTEQLARLHNKRAACMRSILSINASRKDSDAYLDQLNWYQGVLATYNQLIDEHFDSEKALVELAQANYRNS